MRPNQWPWWFLSLFLLCPGYNAALNENRSISVSILSARKHCSHVDRRRMWSKKRWVLKCKSVSVDVSVNRPWLYLTGCLSTEACAGLCDSLEPVNVTQNDLWPRYHVGLGHCIEHLALELWRQTGLQSGCWSQCGHTEQLYNIWAQWSLSCVQEDGGGYRWLWIIWHEWNKCRLFMYILLLISLLLHQGPLHWLIKHPTTHGAQSVSCEIFQYAIHFDLYQTGSHRRFMHRFCRVNETHWNLDQ